MPEKVTKYNFPDGLKCHDCDKTIPRRSFAFRRLVDYTARGVPITELVCRACAGDPEPVKLQVSS